MKYSPASLSLLVVSALTIAACSGDSTSGDRDRDTTSSSSGGTSSSGGGQSSSGGKQCPADESAIVHDASAKDVTEEPSEEIRPLKGSASIPDGTYVLRHAFIQASGAAGADTHKITYRFAESCGSRIRNESARTFSFALEDDTLVETPTEAGEDTSSNTFEVETREGTSWLLLSYFGETLWEFEKVD